MLLAANTVHAQSSSVEMTIESSLDLQTLILSIPCVEVGADYYSLDLRLITQEPTIDFEVAGFDTLDIGGCLAASFTSTLQVSQVPVNTDVYALDFELLQDPLLFRLTQLQDITSALEFYTQNIATQFIQGRCIACHFVDGAADVLNAEILYLPNPSSESNIVKANFTNIKNFIEATPDNDSLYLTKASGGLDHTGGNLVSTQELLLFQELFDLIQP